MAVAIAVTNLDYTAAAKAADGRMERAWGAVVQRGIGMFAHARQLIEAEGEPAAEVARLLGVHRATLYRALEARQSCEDTILLPKS